MIASSKRPPLSRALLLTTGLCLSLMSATPGLAHTDRECLDALCQMQTIHGLEALTAGASEAAPGLEAKPYGKWGVDTAGMDPTVKPGDDFFNYVNGTEVANMVIPPDRLSIGSSAKLIVLSENRSRALVEDLAASKSLTGEKLKIAILYRDMMNQAAKDKLDARPLVPYLADIARIKTRADMTAYMARTRAVFGPDIFGLSVNEDAKNPRYNALFLFQGGTSLPDRDYYLKPEYADKKARYEAYMAQILGFVGYADPAGAAKAIVAFETRIAEAQWSRTESRDRTKTYNPMALKDVAAYAPGFDWDIFFKEAGVSGASKVVLFQNTAIPKIATIWADTPVETLKAWEAFHIVDGAAPYLSERFSTANWTFRSKEIGGALEQRPLWKRSVGAVEDQLGFALGKVYAERYFPAESKQKMAALVADLKTALKARIENLTWMGPETKAKALEKLSRFGVKIGYPDKWFDYTKYDLKPNDLTGNIERGGQFQWNYQLSQLDKPVDPTEWGLTPQTVNAYYSPTRNEIVFPAAILQPPFFDPKADMAVNYGAIGAVIGHEITHGFDDQGRHSDGDGLLTEWWTPEDAAKFESQAARLGAQYDTYEPLPGFHVKGSLTMGENIADLGGLLTALDAYHLSLKGHADPVIDDYTGDQRFFMGFAQIWRAKFRDDNVKQRIVADPHAPNHFRVVGATRNVDAWYDAFDVKPGDKYYVAPADRVRIW